MITLMIRIYKTQDNDLVIKNVPTEGQYSVIEYDKIEVGKIADKYFSCEYLKKMVY